MNTNSDATVLVAASPGPLRSALHALLLSLPKVSAVVIADHPREALKVVSERRPELVIIATGGQRDWKDLPGAIRAAATGCWIAVLTDGETSQTGVDLVLQQGMPPEEVIDALDQLLNREKGKPDGG